MTKTASPPTKGSRIPDHKRRGKKVRPPIPWAKGLLAALPVALGVYYLAFVAPSLVPVPAGVDVPFPAATRFLERVCAWCGEHRLVVLLSGVGLVLPGILFRVWSQRYYTRLLIVASLGLGFTYVSISAPIDRLINAVEENIPEREFPR